MLCLIKQQWDLNIEAGRNKITRKINDIEAKKTVLSFPQCTNFRAMECRIFWRGNCCREC
jgi:hypothetical protein